MLALGKLLGVGSKHRHVFLTVFGKQLAAHKWSIAIDLIDQKNELYEDISTSYKEAAYIPLSLPTVGAIGQNGVVTVKFKCHDKWELQSPADAVYRFDASSFDRRSSFSVIIEDRSATCQALTFEVDVAAMLKGKLLEAPLLVVVSHPLSEITSTRGSMKRDHFHVMIVCPHEFEVQAARRVFERDTNSRFLQAYRDLPFNIRICRDWNLSGTNVAVVAQAHPGGIECMKLICQVAMHFSVDLIAMTGLCSAAEFKCGGVELGSVMVARRTTTLLGRKETEDGQYEMQSQYKEVDKDLVPLISQLVNEGSDEWMKYVPDEAHPPSPRYIRDLTLNVVGEASSEGRSKRQLMDQLQQQLPHVDIRVFDEILNMMRRQPDPWVEATGQYGDMFVITAEGEKYYRERQFLRKDNVTVVFDSMASTNDETEDLASRLTTLKQQLGDRNVKAIDCESHYFMEKATECFAPGHAVVMKGVSDPGSLISKLQKYQKFAASTPAAFLRHFITRRMNLKNTSVLTASVLIAESKSDSSSSTSLNNSGMT